MISEDILKKSGLLSARYLLTAHKTLKYYARFRGVSGADL
jgi:hypothetical protein